jgi:hypothetical protein
MSIIDEHHESRPADLAEPTASAASTQSEFLEQLNCELRDLICSRMVLDTRQRLQPYGLTVEQMQHVMGS